MSLNVLKALLGPHGYLDTPAAMSPFLEERRGKYTGQAALVALPQSVEQLSQLMAHCHQHHIPMVPQGGNTGLCGGACPSNAQAVVISTRRLNRIRQLDSQNYTLLAEAGCILSTAQEAAAEANRYFPLSLAAEGSCTIGGNLATNAGGVAVLRYGNTRDLCLGLEAVLPDGQRISQLQGLRKNNTGYDWRNLLIGAEGTLGIITAAQLKLFPAIRSWAVALLAIPSAQAAVEILSDLRDFSADSLSACELMNHTALHASLSLQQHAVNIAEAPWYLLVELSSARLQDPLTELLQERLLSMADKTQLSDATLAHSQQQRAQLWQIRENIPAAQKQLGSSIKHDVSVAVSQVPDMLERCTKAVLALDEHVRVCAFGHVGDGNIHFNLSQPEAMDSQAFLARWDEFNDVVHDIVMQMGGSFSAEHGIGQLKTAQMARYQSPAVLGLMRAIKQAVDPANVMNPGKLLP